MSRLNIPSFVLNNGVKMPQLGLGTWQMSKAEAVTAVKYALNHGIRHIDTAAYYENESGVGKAVRESGVPREEIFITTKLWNTAHGYENALAAFEQSRQQLGLDYVDLYLIHWPASDMQTLADTWRAFEKLYNEKKIRAIGLSNFHIEHIEHILSICTVRPTVNQIELHLMKQQEQMRAYCNEKNIVVTAWSPLDRGRTLTNPTVLNLAEKYHRKPAQIVIRSLLQLGVVVIPKSANPDRIKENFDVLAFELDESSMKLLKALNEVKQT